jgi:hypothetical protein
MGRINNCHTAVVCAGQGAFEGNIIDGADEPSVVGYNCESASLPLLAMARIFRTYILVPTIDIIWW